MKGWFGLVCSAAAMTVLCGCAMPDGYVPRIPDEARQELLEYWALPENKVMVFAIDPNGAYAVGVDSGAETIRAAAAAATARCNAARAAKGVLCRPEVYAVNNKVVFESMIRRNAH